MIVDPTISEGFPLWGGPRNLRACPSVHEAVPPSPPRTSLFEDVIHYSRQMSKEDIVSIENQHNVLAIPILSMIASEWLTVVSYITTGLTKIEWELENTHYRDPAQGLEGVLDRLHPLRRLMPVYRTMLTEVLNTILNPLNLDIAAGPSHLKKLSGDFTSILDRMDRLQVRTQNIIGLATTIISIEENKRAMKMNRALVKVTYLGILFVPMAFVSSFFSMTPDLSSLKETFWIYFAIALPLTAFCLTVADPPRAWRVLKRTFNRGRLILDPKKKEA